MSQPVGGHAKVVLGVAVPMVAFAVFDSLLFRSVGGKGEESGFAGMALVFQSFIIVPALAVANALLMRLNWKSRAAALFAGLLFPAVAALYEYDYLYGHH